MRGATFRINRGTFQTDQAFFTGVFALLELDKHVELTRQAPSRKTQLNIAKPLRSHPHTSQFTHVVKLLFYRLSIDY
jgi:hypothetical protein